jgi:hypothetical protein
VVSGLSAGAQLVIPASITEAGLTISAVEPAGGGAVPIVGGTATIIYEVTAASPLQSDGITIPLNVFSASPIGVTVRGNLYPLSTVATASAEAPIPRFADVSTAMPFPSCRQAPALGEWSMLALALGLLTSGLLVIRRSVRE